MQSCATPQQVCWASSHLGAKVAKTVLHVWSTWTVQIIIVIRPQKRVPTATTRLRTAASQTSIVAAASAKHVLLVKHVKWEKTVLLSSALMVFVLSQSRTPARRIQQHGN